MQGISFYLLGLQLGKQRVGMRATNALLGRSVWKGGERP